MGVPGLFVCQQQQHLATALIAVGNVHGDEQPSHISCGETSAGRVCESLAGQVSALGLMWQRWATMMWRLGPGT
jgi:hypothetical protein